MRLFITLVLTITAQQLYAEDLIQIYDLAKSNDAQIRVANASRSASYETKSLAKAGVLPNISAQGSMSYTNINRDTNDDNFNSNEASVSLIQPLYRRDRFLIIDQADSTLNRADADYSIAEQDLIVRTVTAYFDILGAQDDLKFIRANLKAIDRQLDQAKQRFEVGLIAITGVYEAQARYDQANADQITALNALDTTWEALFEIINVRPASLAEIKKDIKLYPPEPNEIVEWTGMALKNSPSIASALEQNNITKQEIEVQRSGHYPTLDLIASYKTSSTRSNNLSDSDTGTLLLQGVIPLYLGGGIAAATRQAEYNYQASKDALDQTKRAVTKQVRDAFRGVHTSISRVNALKATVASSQSALDATSAGFDVGTRTLVDVLNSQQDLYRSQRDYTAAYYQYILQHLRLKVVAGTLNREDLVAVNNLLSL